MLIPRVIKQTYCPPAPVLPTNRSGTIGESKRKLKEAIEEGRKKVDELTVAYSKRIAVKEEQIADANYKLTQARQTISEKEEVIDHLETEAKSIRKLLKKSFGLAKGRIGKRLRSIVPGKGQRDD